MGLTPEQERRIVELEKELGHALFPQTREESKSAMDWLMFLETVKQHKDADDEMWRAMKNWN